MILHDLPGVLPLLLLPLLGWIALSASGGIAYLLGLIPLPALVAKDKIFAESVGNVHGAVALTLLALITLHVAGALYHALVKQDGVIRRMLPKRALAPHNADAATPAASPR